MMTLGKTPGEAVGLASQPTMSRWENAPDIQTLIWLGDIAEMVQRFYPEIDWNAAACAG